MGYYGGRGGRLMTTLGRLARGRVSDSSGREQDDEYAASVYHGPRGNVVFNAATCWWRMVLATPPGFVNPPGKDFARADARVQRITKNLLSRMTGVRRH